MAPILPSSARSIIPHPPELRSILSSFHQLVPRFTPTQHNIPVAASSTTNILSRTLPSLLRRQTTTVTATPLPIIPATYSGLDAGPGSGTVVGIVFGSVAGFLLLLWLIYTCFNLGGAWNARSSVVEEEVVHRRSRSPRRSSHSRSEVIEVRERSRHVSPSRHAPSPSPSPSRSPSRTHSPPPRREPRRETVIIEETTRRPARSEREDDIVEVIEEHSPLRRERRTSGRQSGFRTVNPDALGGGNEPVRKVGRR